MPPQPRKPRVFKGLGQLVQGAAMTLADVGLPVGAFPFPVSPETQSCLGERWLPSPPGLGLSCTESVTCAENSDDWSCGGRRSTARFEVALPDGHPHSPSIWPKHMAKPASDGPTCRRDANVGSCGAPRPPPEASGERTAPTPQLGSSSGQRKPEQHPLLP